MKCPHCGALAVIDTDSFAAPARLCAHCNRVWQIDPSELRAGPTSASTDAPPKRKGGLSEWWSRRGAGRDEK